MYANILTQIYRPTYECITLEFPKPEIAIVTLNRPKSLNSMSWQTFEELTHVFEHISNLRDVRVAILQANGKAFSSGLDLLDANENIFGRVQAQSDDVGRRGVLYHKLLQDLQDAATAPEKCRVPVIAAVHGYCIGAGIDIASSCDIRLATKDAKFTIKEVDIGLAADLGTLQRFPKVVGNDAWARELAFTARYFDGNEALEKGYLSHVYDTKEELFQAALKLAETISQKSPVALVGFKENLVYSRDHTIADGLQHVRTLNTALLQSEDNFKAAMALLSKSVPEFAKL